MRSSFFNKTIATLAFLIFALPSLVSADTLRISPATGDYSAGQTFPVKVFVSSIAQAINAVSGVVSFPADKLQVVSLSKTSSVISLWVQEPSYSNSLGTVTFEGVSPNPGFQGSGGLVITINFKVVGAGTAPVKFASGSVLANDGNGTNILKNLYTGSYTLGGAVSLPPAPVPVDATTPVITSATYPDSKVWYSKSSGEFKWNVKNDTVATRILLDKLQNSIPVTVYDSVINTKSVSDIADGIWYLHVGLKNENGWGSTGTYQFKVDTSKPETFIVQEIPRVDKTDPRAKFSVVATDIISGIDYFSMQIDSENPEVWRDSGSGVYQTPITGPGKHTLLAKAYDQAGNFAVTSVDFNIVGIESPKITSYTEEILDNSPLVVKGVALPNITVKISISKGDSVPISISTQSDENGAFTGSFDRTLDRGAYKLWAIAIDKRGAQSEPSSIKNVLVNTPWLKSVGEWLLGILNLLVPILALLFFIIFIILYSLHRLRMLKKKMQGEIRDVEHIVEEAFESIKQRTQIIIELLERSGKQRQLTQDENTVIIELKKGLNEAEDIIRKEVEYVEKEIEDND